jgi:hypothetical protein
LAADADADNRALGAVPLREIGQRRLDQIFTIVAGGGKYLLVLDDLHVIDT